MPVVYALLPHFGINTLVQKFREAGQSLDARATPLLPSARDASLSIDKSSCVLSAGDLAGLGGGGIAGLATSPGGEGRSEAASCRSSASLDAVPSCEGGEAESGGSELTRLANVCGTNR